MTVIEKFQEAEFFLGKMKEELSAIETRHYYSAFLSAVNSIFDHLLEDANNEYLIGVSLEEILNAKKFRTLIHHSGNINAKKFIDWYDDVFKLIRKTESGKIFHVERNRNIHRQIQTPTLHAVMETGDDYHEDHKVRMIFVPSISRKEVENMYNKQADEFIKEINEQRVKNNHPLCTAICTSFHFALGDNLKINLVEACEEFLNDIKGYVVDRYENKFHLYRKSR